MPYLQMAFDHISRLRASEISTKVATRAAESAQKWLHDQNNQCPNYEHNTHTQVE